MYYSGELVLTCSGRCRNSGRDCKWKRSSAYVSHENFRHCIRCIQDIYYNAESFFCPCCGFRVRTRRRMGKTNLKLRISL